MVPRGRVRVMRDLFVLGCLASAILITLRYPYVGILGWTWISFLNPHRLSYGFAFEFPIAMAMGIAAIFAFIVSKEPKKLPSSPLFAIVVILTIWIGITTLAAHDIEWSKTKWETSTKILIMALLSAMLMTTRERVHAMVWVVAITLGYYGIKGGVFTLVTGGDYRVWGPPGTFIADNNQLALALIATIPLMAYLLHTTPYRWMKIGIWVAILMMFFSIIGSHSRGALLGVIAMGGYYVWRTRYKAPAIIAALVVVLVGMWFVPEHWISRMDTISEYEADASALGRLEVWTFAVKLALDNPITGGGFHVSSIQDLYFSYMPDADKGRAFHSIWFEMLGAHGFVGLSIFITMLYLLWSTCRRIRKQTQHIPHLAWAGDLASMIQVSTVGYMATGTFVNLAFFDLIYTIIAIVIGLSVVVQKELSSVPEREGRLAGATRGQKSRSPAAQSLPNVPTSGTRQV